jgi:hypothetical protein
MFKVGMTVDMADFDALNFRDNVSAAVRKVLEEDARIAVRLLEYATQTWTHRPTFRIQPLVKKGNEYSIQFGPVMDEAGRIFSYVELGVQPHWIFPVRSRDGLLHFKSHFTPKTTPGSLVPGPGARSGRWRRAKAVAWPGITPRGFFDSVFARVVMTWASELQTIMDTFGVSFSEAKIERVVEVKTT